MSQAASIKTTSDAEDRFEEIKTVGDIKNWVKKKFPEGHERTVHIHFLDFGYRHKPENNASHSEMVGKLSSDLGSLSKNSDGVIMSSGAQKGRNELLLDVINKLMDDPNCDDFKTGRSLVIALCEPEQQQQEETTKKFSYVLQMKNDNWPSDEVRKAKKIHEIRKIFFRKMTSLPRDSLIEKQEEATAVVCVLMDSHPESMKAALMAIEQDIPLIVMKGGDEGLKNIVELHEKMKLRWERRRIGNEIRLVAVPILNNKDLEDRKELLKNMIEHLPLITIYRPEERHGKALDAVILEALIINKKEKEMSAFLKSMMDRLDSHNEQSNFIHDKSMQWDYFIRSLKTGGAVAVKAFLGCLQLDCDDFHFGKLLDLYDCQNMNFLSKKCIKKLNHLNSPRKQIHPREKKKSRGTEASEKAETSQNAKASKKSSQKTNGSEKISKETIALKKIKKSQEANMSHKTSDKKASGENKTSKVAKVSQEGLINFYKARRELRKYLQDPALLPLPCEGLDCRHCNFTLKDLKDLSAQDNVMKMASEQRWQTCLHPVQELFLWSLLCSNSDVTTALWVYTKDRMGAALFASAVYSGIAKKMEKDKRMDNSYQLKEDCSRFKQLAIKTLQSSTEVGEEKTDVLLRKPCPWWSPPGFDSEDKRNSCSLNWWSSDGRKHFTVMDVALQTNCMAFVAEDLPRQLMSRRWRKKPNYEKLPTVEREEENSDTSESEPESSGESSEASANVVIVEKYEQQDNPLSSDKGSTKISQTVASEQVRDKHHSSPLSSDEGTASTSQAVALEQATDKHQSPSLLSDEGTAKILQTVAEINVTNEHQVSSLSSDEDITKTLQTAAEEKVKDEHEDSTLSSEDDTKGLATGAEKEVNFKEQDHPVSSDKGRRTSSTETEEDVTHDEQDCLLSSDDDIKGLSTGAEKEVNFKEQDHPVSSDKSSRTSSTETEEEVTDDEQDSLLSSDDGTMLSSDEDNKRLQTGSKGEVIVEDQDSTLSPDQGTNALPTAKDKKEESPTSPDVGTKGRTTREKGKDSEQNSACARLAVFRGRLQRLFPTMTMFSLCIVWQVGFILLFSYVLLKGLTGTFHFTNLALIVCVVDILVEEIRQWKTEKVSFRNRSNDCRGHVRNLYGRCLAKFKEYHDQGWNVLDLLSIVIFFVGTGLAFSDVSEVHTAGRLLLAADIVLFILRFLQVFVIIKDLGVWIIMAKKMVIDTTYFMMILLTVAYGYAVASESLLKSEGTEPDWYHVPRKAFFSMFGGFTLDEEENSASPSTMQWVPVYLGVFVVMTNVLLLNLLIARLSSRYSEMETEALHYQAWQNCQAILEFEHRSFLPPPFNILIAVFSLLWTTTRICRCCCSCGRHRRHTGDSDGRGCYSCCSDQDNAESVIRVTNLMHGTCLRIKLHKESTADTSKEVNESSSTDARSATSEGSTASTTSTSDKGNLEPTVICVTTKTALNLTLKVRKYTLDGEKPLLLWKTDPSEVREITIPVKTDASKENKTTDPEIQHDYDDDQEIYNQYSDLDKFEKVHAEWAITQIGKEKPSQESTAS